MKTSPSVQETKTLLANWEKYRGKIVMVIKNKIFATKKASEVNKIVKNIEKDFKTRPLITYIPEKIILLTSS